jgi:hypothetical protein
MLGIHVYDARMLWVRQAGCAGGVYSRGLCFMAEKLRLPELAADVIIKEEPMAAQRCRQFLRTEGGEMRVVEMLEHIHARIQVKLARLGMPTDRETLEEVCVAIACLVRDPDNLRLQMIPVPPEDYTVIEECLALAQRDFAEEIGVLHALVASLQDSMQDEVRAWVEAGQISAGDAPQAIRDMVLERFLDLDGSAEGA